MKNDDIEDVFKKSFDNYEPEVGSKVWKNIKVFLKWGGLAFFINAFIQKIGLATLVTVVVSVAAVIGGAIVLNNNNKNEVNTVVQQTVLEKDSNSLIKTTAVGNSASEQTTTETFEDKENPVVVENAGKNNELLASINASATSGVAPLIVDFSNAGKGKSSVWVFSDQNKEISITKPIHVFDAVGIHTVFLTSSNADGSTDTDTLSIEVSGPNPKTITVSPNGDGMNDEFKLNIQKMVSISSKIIDKNGIIVYQAETAGEWSGQDLKGNELPAGLYYYSINAEGLNGKKYDQKGIINLKR